MLLFGLSIHVFAALCLRFSVLLAFHIKFNFYVCFILPLFFDLGHELSHTHHPHLLVEESIRAWLFLSQRCMLGHTCFTTNLIGRYIEVMFVDVLLLATDIRVADPLLMEGRAL